LKYAFLFQFRAIPVRSSPLSYLLNQAGNVDRKVFRANSFDEAFPDLSKWAEHYNSLGLADLQLVLGEESKRSKGELEIFGAKIPNELVALIGIPSLILLLLQFISTIGYLLNNSEPINVDQASKWSFMLKGFGFLLFGISTILLLPISASVGTLMFAIPESWYRIPVWYTLSLAVIILSLVATVTLDMLRRRVRYDDSPKSELAANPTSTDHQSQSEDGDITMWP
jgi:hypothetical protein